MVRCAETGVLSPRLVTESNRLAVQLSDASETASRPEHQIRVAPYMSASFGMQTNITPDFACETLACRVFKPGPQTGTICTVPIAGHFAAIR